jgi:hypothetical protein
VSFDPHAAGRAVQDAINALSEALGWSGGR